MSKVLLSDEKHNPLEKYQFSDDSFEIAMLLRETLVVCMSQEGVQVRESNKGIKDDEIHFFGVPNFRFLEYSQMLPLDITFDALTDRNSQTKITGWPSDGDYLSKISNAGKAFVRERCRYVAFFVLPGSDPYHPYYFPLFVESAHSLYVLNTYPHDDEGVKDVSLQSVIFGPKRVEFDVELLHVTPENTIKMKAKCLDRHKHFVIYFK